MNYEHILKAQDLNYYRKEFPVEHKGCCDLCKCKNMTKDHQFVMGFHTCDKPKCPCHKDNPTTDKEEAVIAGYDPASPEGDKARIVLRLPDGQLETFIREDEHHQRLQKSRKDWLREEIKRLEGMKKEFLETDPDNIQDKEAYYRNLTLFDIQDHYQKELNQK